MKKILMIGAPISENFGGPSILFSLYELLKKQQPGVNITYLSAKKKDLQFDNKKDLKIIFYKNGFISILICFVAELLNHLRVNISFFTKNRIYTMFKNNDVIFDVWGILYVDSLYRNLVHSIRFGLHFLIAKILGIPIIKYTADIGPFENFLNRTIARFYLNRATLIMARSQQTKQNLFSIGIKSKIIVCPDTAIILKSDKSKNIKDYFDNSLSKHKKIIGISVSHTSEKKDVSKTYIQLLLNLINYLSAKNSYTLILIPNEIYKEKYDDRDVAKKIVDKIQNKNNIYILNQYDNAKELKNIISQCDFFIGSRYHSIIASLSSGVPTLAIGWHHKYYECMKIFGQSNFVFDLKENNFSDLVNMIDELIEERLKIKDELSLKIPKIQDKIFSCASKSMQIIDQELYLSN